ncbi:FeoA family protein [Kallipyga massiliensis]|uniref:FeoA family protein n=1 Tax=Kallipyga massiliensis TaxID=1472764 RepID=UPI0004B37235|nr:FeoA family protein [Kallipyga massiliensis]
MKTLLDLKPGDRAEVVRVHGRGPLKRRFQDMGLIKGTPFDVVKVAPLGDPVEIVIKGYNLSIRKEDGKDIEIKNL